MERHKYTLIERIYKAQKWLDSEITAEYRRLIRHRAYKTHKSYLEATRLKPLKSLKRLLTDLEAVSGQR